MAAKPLVVKIVGETDFKKAQSGLAKFGKAAAIGFVGVATAVGSLGVAGYKLGESFDGAYDTIAAGTGATGDALKEVEASFDNVLGNVPDSFGDVSTAIADVNTALGSTGPQLEAVSTKFLELAKVSGEDLGDQIKSVTRSFGDWGVAAADQIPTMDKLWSISQSTGIGVSELSDQLVKTGAPLRQLGFSMEESAAMFGKWNKEGVNTDIIFSGVRAAISRFAKAGEDIPTAFAGATEAIKNAGSASEATQIAIETFGAKAGPDLAAAVREGRFEIDDLVDSLGGADGAISTTVEQTESFGEKWAKFKNKMAVTFKVPAMAVFDGLGNLLDWLSPYLDEFSGGIIAFGAAWTAADGDITSVGFPGLMERIAGILRLDVLPVLDKLWQGAQQVGGVLATAGLGIAKFVGPIISFAVDHGDLVLGALTGIGVAVATVVVPAFIAWAAGAAAAAAATLIAAAPFIALGAALAAVGAALFWAYNNLDWFKTAIDAVVGAVTWFVGVLWDAATAVIGWVAALDWQSMLDGAVTVLSAIWDAVSWYFGQIQLAISVVSAIFHGDWGAAWDGMRQLFENFSKVVLGLSEALWSKMKSWASSAMSALAGFVRRGASNVVGAIRGMPGRIAAAARGMWDGIVNSFRKILRRIGDLWSSLSFTVPSVDIPGIGKIGGQTFSLPRPAFLADGGVADSPILAMIGEYPGARSNPEIAAPQSIMRATVLDALREVMGPSQQQAQQPTLHIENVHVEGDRDVWQELNLAARMLGAVA